MHIGPQSGKFAVVHNFGLPITHMFNWNLDSISHTPETYYASNTYWGANRNPGVIDWSGNFSVFNGGYLFFPGQYIGNLELFTAPDDGNYGRPGTTYCGQAIVESVELTWAWGAEQSLIQQVNFAANGCVASRNRFLNDTTIENPSKMCGLQIQWVINNESPVPGDYTQIYNVQQATLSLSATNPEYVNSSTGCCTHRRPGNIDWTLALNMTDNRSVLFTREDLLAFRLWNSPTDFWQLLYGIFGGSSNVVANRQTGEIQSQVANFSMKGISKTGTLVGDVTHYIGAIPTILWPAPLSTIDVPGKPGKPSGTQNGADVDVSWAAPGQGGSVDGYTIWAGDGVDFACVASTSGTSGTDEGLPALGNYYYRVAGYNVWGQGEFSDVSDVVTVS
jgi:hypothetical protein